jgi:hypothetical protein
MKVRNKKTIREIRIHVSGRSTYEHDGWIYQTGIRFALLLAKKHNFQLSPCDYILIDSADISVDTIELTGVIPELSKVMFHVKAGFSEELFDEKDGHVYLVNLIARVLTGIAILEGSDTEPIEKVRQELLVSGADTEIYWPEKVTKSGQYLIEPFIKIKGYGATSTLLYVRLTERHTGRTATRLVLQTNLYEVFGLTGKFSVTNGELIIKSDPKPKTNIWILSYSGRGYTLPIRVELSDFDLR